MCFISVSNDRRLAGKMAERKTPSVRVNQPTWRSSSAPFEVLILGGALLCWVQMTSDRKGVGVAPKE